MRFAGGERMGLKWAAVGVVALLEVGAVVFLVIPSLSQSQNNYHYYPTVSNTSTTTSKKVTTSKTKTTSPALSITVTSATIVKDRLVLSIKNVGAVPTSSLSLIGVCTPRFATCFNYTSIGGGNPTHIFVLPPGKSFQESLSGVCTVPETNCGSYYPVANFTYYLVLGFSSPSGKSSFLAVSAKAADTYPLDSAVQGVVYTFPVFSGNLSGSLNAVITTNSSESQAEFAGNLYVQNPGGVFTLRLLSKTTGCGGTYPVACSSGNVTLTMGFSTVTTGIATQYYPGPYLLVIRDLTLKRPTYFAIWVQYKKET